MSTEYQIPKRKVRAAIACNGEPVRDVWIYLSERAQSHSGPERPSDLLNGAESFIPATDDHDRFSLLQRDAISVCTVPADAEAGPGPAPIDEDVESLVRHDLRVKLLGDREVEGTLTFVRPEGQQRLQDGLNDSESFFAVRDRDQVHLINRRHVIWIAQD